MRVPHAVVLSVCIICVIAFPYVTFTLLLIVCSPPDASPFRSQSNELTTRGCIVLLHCTVSCLLPITSTRWHSGVEWDGMIVGRAEERRGEQRRGQERRDSEESVRRREVRRQQQQQAGCPFDVIGVVRRSGRVYDGLCVVCEHDEQRSERAGDARQLCRNFCLPL